MTSTTTNERVPAPGFTEPVHDAQRTFRVLLEAMSRPGRVAALPVLPASGGRLAPETLAVLLALADLDTPAWVRPGLAADADLAFLRFHCGCRMEDDPARAAFAVVGADVGPDELDALPVGTVAYPDRSATVIVQADGLRAGKECGRGAVLRGPGIEGEAHLAVDGAGPGFWGAVRGNAESYPLGLDFLVVARGGIACLPRSVTVEA